MELKAVMAKYNFRDGCEHIDAQRLLCTMIGGRYKTLFCFCFAACTKFLQIEVGTFLEFVMLAHSPGSRNTSPSIIIIIIITKFKSANSK